MRRGVRDPFVSSALVLGSLVAVGFAVFGLAWRGLAAQASVPFQVPYLVSGAIGGLALIGFALGLLAVQLRREREARRHAALARAVRSAEQALLAAQSRRGGRP